MKKVCSCILLLLFAATLSAMHVQCVGLASMYVQEGDTLFIFLDEVHLSSTVGNVDWYSAETGEPYATATSDIYPDEGGYYIVYGGRKEYFYVFRYASLEPTDLVLNLELDCHDSRLLLEGNIPIVSYTTPSGQQRTFQRECTISYTDIAWSSDNMQWEDSLASIDGLPFAIGSYPMPALYKSTDIVLHYDVQLREDLMLDPDSVVYSLRDPIANKAIPTSITTVRGKEGELSNEMERPKDSQILKGSAPLDILFKANPTEAVEFYEWNIYFGSQLLATRTDAEHRYSFTSPGNYRVVCRVKNTECPCPSSYSEGCLIDSTEISISVSTSMLLVPNVFTPNGDGQNDEFRVAYRSLKEFHCWVYNRWGKLVYSWTDPAKGWDGTINGRPAAEGAYFYVIRALGTDAMAGADYTGKISYRKKQLNADESVVGVYQLSGDINLIRGEK